MKWIGVVAVVGVVGGLGVGASGAAGAGSKSCTGGFTEGRSAFGVTVRGDTCAKARDVAERAAGVAPKGCVKVTKKGKVSFKKPCVQLAYSCTGVKTNNGLSLRVTCTRGARVVKFRY